MNFAGKDEFHGVSMSRHLLVGLQLYSESTTGLSKSGAMPKVISHTTVKKLHLHMQTSNRLIKVANCALEKCMGTLNEVPLGMGELLVPMDFLLLEETRTIYSSVYRL